MDLIKTGKIISEARKNKNMTQKQLASRLHISDKAISKWERGLGYPDISFLIPLSQILDISLYELLSGEKGEIEEILKNTIHYSNSEIKRKNKQTKKKILIFLSIIAILFILFAYKLINFYIYSLPFINDEDYNKFINGFQIKDEINVESEQLTNHEYIEYDNIKFKNIFDGYEKQEQDSYISYTLRDSNDDTKNYFGIGLAETYLDTVLNEIEKLSDSKKVNKQELLKGIDNDLELFNYIYLTKNYNPKITYKIKNLKKNYYEKMSVYIALPQIESITEIKGDLEGYILNISNDMVEVNIKKEDKRIMIFMIGYDKETIKEILNTLIIE